MPSSTVDQVDWWALQRVLAVANGKGGVGKTTTADHLAGSSAKAGRRTLLIGFDPQHNTQQDLGYADGDDGESLARCIIGGGVPPTILYDVRPNLDVICAGPELLDLADWLRSRRLRHGSDALLAVPRALADVVRPYDLAVLDCPPANSDVLQDAALAMARYLLVPTHTDKSSRLGLVEMAKRFTATSLINPQLVLLGVLLYGTTGAATTVRRLARQWIEVALGGSAPVFKQTIRHSEAAAFDIRERGLLSWEIDPWDPDAPARSRTPTGRLGRDFELFAVEALAELARREREAAA